MDDEKSTIATLNPLYSALDINSGNYEFTDLLQLLVQNVISYKLYEAICVRRTSSHSQILAHEIVQVQTFIRNHYTRWKRKSPSN
jgi:hypothetical protein